MRIVIFGLSISSAWGNGHATLLRGLFKALHHRGHELHFFERDTVYYSEHRDAASFPYVHLHLYEDWRQVSPVAAALAARCDVAMVTSYCPDGIAASDLVLSANVPRRIFYDMDTPVTLDRLQQGESVPYIPAAGLGGFDLVLSYTGGDTLDQLRTRLGAHTAATLYGWVDPDVHFRVPAVPEYMGDLSYLGTYSADRQKALEHLFMHPAELLPERQFTLGGAMYPPGTGWPANIRRFDHVPPPRHPAFYSSSRLTLNITRYSMAQMGYCPSGRLFEAAACGTVVLSDWWEGLDGFFEPVEEILIASDWPDTVAALNHSDLRSIAKRARERTLDCHTAAIRAEQFLSLAISPRNEGSTPKGSAVLKGA
jgi:spore maturation protein CgeB